MDPRLLRLVRLALAAAPVGIAVGLLTILALGGDPLLIVWFALLWIVITFPALLPYAILVEARRALHRRAGYTFEPYASAVIAGSLAIALFAFVVASEVGGMPGRDGPASAPGGVLFVGAITIAFAPATLALAALSALAATRGSEVEGLCDRCNYDRTGLTEATPCPECGHATGA